MIAFDRNHVSRSWTVGLSLLFLALAAGCLLAAADSAPARTIQPYVYLESFNGEDADGGKFLHIDRLAMDQGGDRLAVVDGQMPTGRVILFDPDGNAIDFPDLGTTNLPFSAGQSFGTAARAEIAFDEGPGAAEGRLYFVATHWERQLEAHLPGGSPVGAPWPLCGEACGSALWGGYSGVNVAPDGRVWVLNRATSSVNGVGFNNAWAVNPDGTVDESFKRLSRPLGLPNHLDFDSQGNLVYTTEESPTFGGEYAEVRKATPDFEPLGGPIAPGVATAVEVDRSTDWIYVNKGNLVEVYDDEGHLVDSFGGPEGPYLGILNSVGTVVRAADKRAYVSNERSHTVDVFERGPAVVVPTVESNPAQATASDATLSGTVDPDGGGDTTACFFEYGAKPTAMGFTANCAEGQELPSAGGEVDVTAAIAGLTKGNRYFFRLRSDNGSGHVQASQLRSFVAANEPKLDNVAVTNVNTNTAEIEALITPEGDITSYRVEYGTTPALGEESGTLKTIGNLANEDVLVPLAGLTPDETYYYRLVAENATGSVVSDVKSFNTFDFESVLVDDCANALARQQTGASMLLDCRAYELVSAPDTGGFNVTSDLVGGQDPYPGFPGAQDSALYSVDGGAIPGVGNPPNKGPDPYRAERGSGGWTTSYIGIPADVDPQSGPFSSRLTAASEDLRTVAFSGADICDPCFPDGSSGIPVRRGGELIQGMAGSLPVADPEPAGEIRRHISADGSHLVFGSEQRFEPQGLDGDLTIYLRDLDAGVTEVASTSPGGTTLNGTVAALDVSADGSRVLIGVQVGTDGAGNRLYDLYTHFEGQAASRLIADTAGGVVFNGMSEDGGVVYFSTADQIGPEADAGTDLFRADIGPGGSEVTKVSSGDSDACNPPSSWNSPDGATDCSVLAVAGGGGVSADGETVYFLSPEQLDAGAVADQPNLYHVGPGGQPELVATLEVGSPLVANARESAAEHHSADFQVNADGSHAVFVSGLSLTGYENRGFAQVYRFDAASGALDCASCAPTNAPSRGDARLASNGASLTDDGRVFFTTGDALALRDANRREDVYEWTDEDGGTVELISSGIDADNSSLLSVSADGTDVFFFTRQKLTQDGDVESPLAKLYTAREGGGFFAVPPSAPCAAADECRGAGTLPAPIKPIRTVAADPGQVVDCSGTAARAKALTRRANRLQRKAKRAGGKRAQRLRVKARNVKRKAKRQRAALQRCRRSGGMG